ncbi:pancreatic lipase-related protein 2-like [Zerene cesonia]|uniref:pancreatic lipase-related protein 2-like n=1 Tax=Zerene cesonia TaxID=33412 RepID=UPI0018E4DB37|nr:pancreatic lipase-related protein 2-like [Zerene cesonia]
MQPGIGASVRRMFDPIKRTTDSCSLAIHAFIPNGQIGTDWTVFPDENGILQIIDLKIDSEKFQYISEVANYYIRKTRFWLYTSDNKNQYEELFIDSRPHNKTHFKPDRPVIMVTHGWIHSGHSPSAQYIKNEYLKKMDVNVIVVDWHLASRTSYLMASFLTAIVGEDINDMVRTLIKEYDFDINDLHLIGHSLGAHVVGRAGNALKRHKVIVPRITGLDPARPLFEFPRVFNAISKNNAYFVDIIHTNVGVFGFIKDIGHADFYPNGGFKQNHCRHPDMQFDSDHNCAWVYYGESINSEIFVSHRCPSYDDFNKRKCNDIQYMGSPCDSTARGKYYLNVTK